jgi:type III restriction enzyme
MMSLNTIFGGEHQINTHDDGFIIRDAKRKIASTIGVDESICNNALRTLFGPFDTVTLLTSQEEQEFEKANKLLEDMSLREYSAFLVNNRDRLIEVFRHVSESELGEIRETDLLETVWTIPQYQYYKQPKKVPAQKVMLKNVFANYGDHILVHHANHRSITEIELERWCESYDAVKYIYKNGDKGDDFFSLVYRRGFRRNNFYPDYIIQLQNGDIWIIEAKGGMQADGTSNNIDGYAERKFEALKDYGERHPKIKWGFVRAVGTQLYLSNTVWTDDMTNRNVWKPIEVFM